MRINYFTSQHLPIVEDIDLLRFDGSVVEIGFSRKDEVLASVCFETKDELYNILTALYLTLFWHDDKDRVNWVNSWDISVVTWCEKGLIVFEFSPGSSQLYLTHQSPDLLDQYKKIIDGLDAIYSNSFILDSQESYKP